MLCWGSEAGQIIAKKMRCEVEDGVEVGSRSGRCVVLQDGFLWGSFL
jgi:hypothetical protein